MSHFDGSKERSSNLDHKDEIIWFQLKVRILEFLLDSSCLDKSFPRLLCATKIKGTSKDNLNATIGGHLFCSHRNLGQTIVWITYLHEDHSYHWGIDDVWLIAIGLFPANDWNRHVDEPSCLTTGWTACNELTDGNRAKGFWMWMCWHVS